MSQSTGGLLSSFDEAQIDMVPVWRGITLQITLMMLVSLVMTSYSWKFLTATRERIEPAADACACLRSLAFLALNGCYTGVPRTAAHGVA